jgi:ankyrin repeat protein
LCLLQQREINLCRVNRDGELPLHKAIKNKKENTAILLMKFSGDSINVAEGKMFTPLVLAMAMDNARIVRHLLVNKAKKPNNTDLRFRESNLIYARCSDKIKRMLVFHI